MMEGDSPSITRSDEYRLLETYCQKRKPQRVFMCSLEAQTGGEKYGNVAEKLTRIVDSRLLIDDGLETDSVNTDVIEQLVDLLKKSGDDLNEKIEKNHELLGYLQCTFSYDFFEKLISAFIKSVVPEFPQSRNKHEQIALTFEVTSRLRALDLHPMNRVMGFGAQYLQKNFTPWVKQHGGWEKAFDDNDEVH
ncbi:apoptosis facilitator Bcl-2-like protein 14 [Rhinichthys klamathensis goyatoka]|uniref:apoptosis facilitator Bcl-2-like protein 14 n=1 Tax=Rhinichthys klamathensis goyatoka TaxID=3034132 RepID=UPI0024B507F9|nr:apoptosis facilitator Bcl-2-like protein 14 [Rhinichthys klamathensis goyatoka]